MNTFEKSESLKDFAPAYAKMQASLVAVKKSSDNPYFGSKYAELSAHIDVARKPLADNGLSVFQNPATDLEHGVVTVTTMLLHTSGEYICGSISERCKDITNVQSVGSCITYLRRYAYSSMVGTVAEGEDDDGNGAAGNSGQQPAKTPQQPRDQVKKQNSRGAQPPAGLQAQAPQPPKDDSKEQWITRDGVRQLNPIYQEAHGLINKEHYTEIEALINSAKISSAQWKAWLSAYSKALGHEVKSLGNVLEKWVDGIKDKLSKEPDSIINFKADASPATQPTALRAVDQAPDAAQSGAPAK